MRPLFLDVSTSAQYGAMNGVDSERTGRGLGVCSPCMAEPNDSRPSEFTYEPHAVLQENRRNSDGWTVYTVHAVRPGIIYRLATKSNSTQSFCRIRSNEVDAIKKQLLLRSFVALPTSLNCTASSGYSATGRKRTQFLHLQLLR